MLKILLSPCVTLCSHFPVSFCVPVHFAPEVGILGYAYEKIGINSRYIFGLLFLSLMGSCVNIPVAKLPSKQVLSDQVVTFYGMRYVIPSVQKWTRTVIAVNVRRGCYPNPPVSVSP